jgi:hypothetical protein
MDRFGRARRQKRYRLRNRDGYAVFHPECNRDDVVELIRNSLREDRHRLKFELKRTNNLEQISDDDLHFWEQFLDRVAEKEAALTELQRKQSKTSIKTTSSLIAALVTDHATKLRRPLPNIRSYTAEEIKAEAQRLLKNAFSISRGICDAPNIAPD